MILPDRISELRKALKGSIQVHIPITMYGGEHCEDTHRSRARLRALGIEFHDLLIDHDTDLQRLVRTLNNGNQSTPTIIIGGGSRKLVLTEPTDEELDHALAEYGFVQR